MGARAAAVFMTSLFLGAPPHSFSNDVLAILWERPADMDAP